MSRWGKPTKNKKRRDPRYFLNESVEGEETLNEFELGFDLDDESDEELMRDQEWVEREKKKLMPAVEAVIKFLESDEPQALGIERSTLHRYKKFLNPLVRLLNADQEYLVKLYNASQDEREGRTPMAEQVSDRGPGRPVEDSIVVQQAKEKGFPLAAAAAIGLATLDTSNGPTLLKNANKYIYKGKLGELIQGANGIYATLDQVVRNFRGKRQAPAAAEASPEQAAPKQSASKQEDPAAAERRNRAMMGRLEEIIKKELKSVLGEATRADYYACLEKVPQMYSANSREFGKCLDNPSAYKPPESKKRTLDDIPDIEVSRTGGPRPKDHPFNKYNPRDYDE